MAWELFTAWLALGARCDWYGPASCGAHIGKFLLWCCKCQDWHCWWCNICPLCSSGAYTLLPSIPGFIAWYMLSAQHTTCFGLLFTTLNFGPNMLHFCSVSLWLLSSLSRMKITNSFRFWCTFSQMTLSGLILFARFASLPFWLAFLQLSALYALC